MSGDRHITVLGTEWQGIAIQVTYEADYLKMIQSHGRGSAHLQIMAMGRERLPITKTGYRSHFGDPQAVEEAGGPVAYARAWLDHAARQPEWAEYAQTNRQLTLF